MLPSAFTISECGYPYCENKGWFAFNESGKVGSLLALAQALAEAALARALLHPYPQPYSYP